MPSPMHEGSVSSPIERIMGELPTVCVFKSTPVRTSLLLCCAASPAQTAKAVKQPDAAYYFIDHDPPTDSDRCPRFVFAIAFSLSYGSVRQDAEHGLLRAHGSVKLVVLVKLSSGGRSRRGGDRENGG